MNLKQLEHVLRAGGSITGCREIVVVGSQALLMRKLKKYGLEEG